MIRESYFTYLSDRMFDKQRDALEPYLTLEFRSKFKDLLKNVVENNAGLKTSDISVSVKRGSYDLDKGCLHNFILEVNYSFNLNTLIGPEFKVNDLISEVCTYLFSDIVQEVYPFVIDYTLKNPYVVYSDLGTSHFAFFSSRGLPMVDLTFLLYDQNELDPLNYNLEDDPRLPATLKNIYRDSKAKYISRERTRLLKEKEKSLNKDLLPDVPKMVDWAQKYIESYIKDHSPSYSLFNSGGQSDQKDYWIPYHRYARLTYNVPSLHKDLKKEFALEDIKYELFEIILNKVASRIRTGFSSSYLGIEIVRKNEGWEEYYLVSVKVDQDVTDEFDKVINLIRK